MEIFLADGISVRNGKRLQYMGIYVETRKHIVGIRWCDGEKCYHENMNGISELPSGAAGKTLRRAAVTLEPMIRAYIAEPTHDAWWSIKKTIRIINEESSNA